MPPILQAYGRVVFTDGITLSWRGSATATANGIDLHRHSGSRSGDALTGNTLAGNANLDALRTEFPFLLRFDRRLAGPGAGLLDEALRAKEAGIAPR
ncbi:hypothetical protein AB0R12_23395 [Streptomyces niveus]|uniref:hypothetical protein n=1 Tax=Streptomyces niveus TaxID=193462 RepID=UPI003443B11A